MEYLSKRLKTILKMVPKGVVADIGADHGKLMIALFEEGIISHGYAVENKQGPYNRLVKALTEKGLENDIVPLFSDGIKDIPDIVHTVIIAGLGGNLIIDILKKYPRKTKQLETIIVDAHTAIPKVREEISKLGFVIAEEKMVREDDIFYEIIKFVRADVAFYGDKDIEFGPILRNEKSATFKEKYQNRINEINKLLAKKNLPKDRADQLTKEKERIQGIL
jgi:tRNA (adenine22-N1)-methyltransferase